MENTLLCANTIENMTFELYTNNNKKCYQTLIIKTPGAERKTNMIAPVDFFEIASAIMCSNDLTGFIDAVNGTWSDELLETMINDLFDASNGY